MLKISEKFKVLNLLASTYITADLNGDGVSVEEFEDDALVILSSGLIASTNVTFAVNVQASTVVGGIYSTIGSFTTLGPTDDYKVGAIPVSLKGDNKFVRLQVDAILGTVGVTVDAILGATILVRPRVAEAGINSPTVA
jgi:hypothetical protein